MTNVKLDSKIGGNAGAALEPHVAALYARPGVRIMAIAELRHVERVQPAPDSEKDPSVKMRITSMEIPGRDQEGIIREAQQALHLQRTAAGTLDDQGQLELGDGTLKLIGARLNDMEVARLSAGVHHWARYARRILTATNLSHTDVLREMKTVANGLKALEERAAFEDED